MEKSLLRKLERASDGDLLLYLFRRINHCGVVIISSAFEPMEGEGEGDERPLWADAFLLQGRGDYPRKIYLSHAALRRWCPSQDLWNRMVNVLNIEFCREGLDSEDFDSPILSSDYHEIPGIAQAEDFIALRANIFERKWCEFAAAQPNQSIGGWSMASAQSMREIKHENVKLEAYARSVVKERRKDEERRNADDKAQCRKSKKR